MRTAVFAEATPCHGGRWTERLAFELKKVKMFLVEVQKYQR